MQSLHTCMNIFMITMSMGCSNISLVLKGETNEWYNIRKQHNVYHFSGLFLRNITTKIKRFASILTDSNILVHSPISKPLTCPSALATHTHTHHTLIHTPHTLIHTPHSLTHTHTQHSTQATHFDCKSQYVCMWTVNNLYYLEPQNQFLTPKA